MILIFVLLAFALLLFGGTTLGALYLTGVFDSNNTNTDMSSNTNTDISTNTNTDISTNTNTTPTVTYGPNDVVLFRGINYDNTKDYWAVPGVGKHNVPASVKNEISSIKIPSGQNYHLIVYAGPSYTGSNKIYKTSVADLGGSGFNDTIESVELLKSDPLANNVVLYSNANYTGNFWVVPSTGKNNVPSPVKNSVSSIKIPSGQNYYLVAYAGTSYVGANKIYSSSISNLSGTGFDDTIESVELFKGNPLEGKVVLYKNTNYTGDFWVVPGTGNYVIPTSSSVRNAASSIYIPSGKNYFLTVYDNDNYTGTSKLYSTSVSNLSGTGLDNNIASLKLQVGNPIDSTKVTLYDATAYNPVDGYWSVPGLGQYTLSTTNPLRNKASSIKIPSGYNYYLTVYDNDTCTSSSNMKTYNTSISNLSGTGLDNDIACVKLSNTPPVDPSKVVLYKGTNYANEHWEVPAANDYCYMIPTTSPVRNESSSIKIPSGYNYYLRAYDADNCTGTERAYTSSVSDLSGSGLNNDIASVKLRIGAPTTTTTTTTTTKPTGSVVLYKDKFYAGSSWTVPGVGQHTIPTSSPVRNEASSIRIPSGYFLKIWDKDDCTGNYRTYTSSISSLEGTGMNNDVACVQLSYL